MPNPRCALVPLLGPLSGSVPPELGELTDLTTLRLDGNHLTGKSNYDSGIALRIPQRHCYLWFPATGSESIASSPSCFMWSTVTSATGGPVLVACCECHVIPVNEQRFQSVSAATIEG